MAAVAVVGAIAGLAGGIFSFLGKRKEIKGLYQQMWADIRQSEEREKALLYNADIEVMKADAQANALMFNQEIRQDVSRHRLSVMELDLTNRGVELSGSPLVAMTAAIAEMGADYSEAQRQADIVEIEGQTRHDMMDRSAQIEFNNRGLVSLGWKNTIKGAEWSQTSQALGIASSAIGSAASIRSSSAQSSSMLSNMGSSYPTAK